MFVGEGPGEQEDRQGLPFVGRSGQLLDRLVLEEMGLTRDDLYIANTIKCRPPGNRDPLPDEIESCWPYLDKQLELIDPRVVVTLGNFATKLLLGTTEGISRLRGRTYPYRSGYLVPTFHPSAALRGGGTVRSPDESRPGASQRGPAHRPAAQGSGAPSGPAGPARLRGPARRLGRSFEDQWFRTAGLQATPAPRHHRSSRTSPGPRVPSSSAPPPQTVRSASARCWPAFCAPGTPFFWAVNLAPARPPSRKAWLRHWAWASRSPAPRSCWSTVTKRRPAGSSCTLMSGALNTSRRSSTSLSRSSWRTGRRPLSSGETSPRPPSPRTGFTWPLLTTRAHLARVLTTPGRTTVPPPPSSAPTQRLRRPTGAVSSSGPSGRAGRAAWPNCP